MRLFVARSPNFAHRPATTPAKSLPVATGEDKVVEARSEQVPSIGRDLISIDGSFQKLLALVSELAPLRAIDRTGCPASHTRLSPR